MVFLLTEDLFWRRKLKNEVKERCGWREVEGRGMKSVFSKLWPTELVWKASALRITGYIIANNFDDSRIVRTKSKNFEAISSLNPRNTILFFGKTLGLFSTAFYIHKIEALKAPRTDSVTFALRLLRTIQTYKLTQQHSQSREILLGSDLLTSSWQKLLADFNKPSSENRLMTDIVHVYIQNTLKPSEAPVFTENKNVFQWSFRSLRRIGRCSREVFRIGKKGIEYRVLRDDSEIVISWNIARIFGFPRTAGNFFQFQFSPPRTRRLGTKHRKLFSSPGTGWQKQISTSTGSKRQSWRFGFSQMKNWVTSNAVENVPLQTERAI